ncbi:MAG: endonuclease III [Syntrophomonadaceae bacterium]|jgi:endonuclease-3
MIIPKKIKQIIIRLAKEYPDAATRLHYANTFQLLIAVILSAQTTDEQVNKVTPRLFQKCPNPYQMANIGIEELEELIKGVGLYRSKAKFLKEAARMIQERFNGEVPSGFDDLLQLPGVGRKTANVVRSVGFNQPGLGVDTHVHRVANRIGLVKTNSPRKTEDSLKGLIPQEKWNNFHHWLIHHGRRVCRARKPDCTNCILRDCCEKNQV